MDLTTIQRVMMVEPSLPDSKDNLQLEILITAISRKIEVFLGRTIKKDTYEQYFEVNKFSEDRYRLRAYPITREDEITPGVPNPLAVYNFNVQIPRANFGLNYKTGYLSLVKDTTAFDPFTQDPNSINGISNLITSGVEALRVVYHGGMADDTADFIAKYPDIEYEVILQIIFEYKRKKNLTMLTVGAGGNSSETYEAFELRKELKRALRPYRSATGIA